MKLVKHLIIIALVSIVFVGSIGVGVFKHICAEDGTMISYLIDTSDDHCDDHHEDIPPCCADEEKDDCCSDEVEYKILKMDFFESMKLSFVSFPIHIDPKVVYGFSEEVVDAYYAIHYINPPPPDNRQIRLQKEMWII